MVHQLHLRGHSVGKHFDLGAKNVEELVAAIPGARYGGGEARRVHHQLAHKGRAQRCSCEFTATADVSPRYCGLLGIDDRNSFSIAGETRARKRRSRHSRGIAVDGSDGKATIVRKKLHGRCASQSGHLIYAGIISLTPVVI